MAYDPNNIFARIIRGDLPSQKVYEDNSLLAFHDISKSAPVHVLVIPKGEYSNLSEFVTSASPESVSYFFKKVTEIANSLCSQSGFRIITNTGDDACQTVQHFHVHILGGQNLGSLVTLNSN